MTNYESAREQVVAAISRHADHSIEQGMLAMGTDAAIEISLIDHLARLVERNISIPEETTMLLMGLLVVFEMRRRENQVDGGETRQ